MMYPLVLDLADDGMPVTVTCLVLEPPPRRSTNGAKAPLSQRDWDDAHLINAARDERMKSSLAVAPWITR